jgi:hypothetical protein
VAGDGVWNECCEAVDADLHPVVLFLRDQ